MSTPHLPAELLDHVVDLLHETVPTLRNCCLVSKSLVPRARTYLFANVTFLTERQLRSWKENFPDPSTSPAHYTKTLVISFPYVFTAADARAGSWISGFSHVTQLVLGSTVAYANRLAISLVPLHGFSPALKSLHVSFTGLPSLRIFNLILSFPLLDDLTVATYGTPINTVPDGWVTIAQPSSPPTFSGTLRLFLKVGMGTITRQLLSLPGGIHFRKLDLIWSHEEDPSSASALVGRCSRTLEYLNITCNTLGMPILPPPLALITYLYSRPAEVGLRRPFEGDKTQKCSVYVQKPERQTGPDDTPNHNTQPPKSSNHTLRARRTLRSRPQSYQLCQR